MCPELFAEPPRTCSPLSTALGVVSCVCDVKRLPWQNRAAAVTSHSAVGSSPQRLVAAGAGCRRNCGQFHRTVITSSFAFCALISCSAAGWWLWFEPRLRVNYSYMKLNQIASFLNTEAAGYTEMSVSAYCTARCRYTEGRRTRNNASHPNQET